MLTLSADQRAIIITALGQYSNHLEEEGRDKRARQVDDVEHIVANSKVVTVS